MTGRDRIKTLLRAAGLDRPISRARYLGRLVINPEFRRVELINRREFHQWRRNYGTILAPSLLGAGPHRRALIVTKGTINGCKVETALIKGLELGGFEPIVLTDKRFAKYFRVAGVRELAYWEQFLHVEPAAEASRIVASANAVEDLLPVEHAGARVGKFALSTSFRSLRAGRLDFADARTRQVLTGHVASGMARAAAAHRMLDRLRPDLVVFMGNRYTGHGEVMDVAIDRGIDVITWFDAHRSNALILKRYNRNNRDQHHASLSDASWQMMQQRPWGAADREALHRELADSYAAGDWYSRGGTQTNKAIIPTAELRRQLNLDPRKPTAVIFPHVIWDATLFWGTDLFNNYEDWLIETVRAACANSHVNWVIKIHPVHVAKNAMERIDEEAGEVAAIRRRIGPLPPHVTLIPPDTRINTYSLFAVMDYCLTVRGTIGIEAASMGIRVLTAGTGRYDHRGFTTDSTTAAEYLDRLAHLQALRPLNAAERELAERYAYGAFLLRPWLMSSIVISHDRDVEATMRVHVKATSSSALRDADDLRAFGAWAADGAREDFLADAPPAARLEQSA
jgi:hypothetical protein